MKLSLRGWAAIAVVVCGCQANNGDNLFDVTTTLTNSTCGAAVEVDDTETFQIQLTRDDDALKWYSVDTGDTIQGSIDEADFVLANVESFVLSESNGVDPGCQVRRHDAYSGTLTSSGDTITKATGSVVSSYTQVTGYDCDALIGTADGFTDLPCEIKYDFVATPAK